MRNIQNEAFEKWLFYMTGFEGGEVDHPNDRGKYTNKGVTIGLWSNLAPKLFGIPGTAATLAKITYEQHREIALWHWDQVHGDDVEGGIAIQLAEQAWGSGLGSMHPIQHAINENGLVKINVDGAYGPISRATMKLISNRIALVKSIFKYRKQFYENYIKRDTTQEVFRIGWWRRLDYMENLSLQYMDYNVKKKTIS